jgi:hypothetical protein
MYEHDWNMIKKNKKCNFSSFLLLPGRKRRFCNNRNKNIIIKMTHGSAHRHNPEIWKFQGSKKKIRIVAKAHEHTKKDSRESVSLHTYHESRRVEWLYHHQHVAICYKIAKPWYAAFLRLSEGRRSYTQCTSLIVSRRKWKFSINNFGANEMV